MGRGLQKLISGILLWTILVSLSLAWTGKATAHSDKSLQHKMDIPTGEGFDSVPELLPNEVMKAWDSTFAFYFDNDEKIGIATTFLFKKLVIGEYTELYFITNKHAVRDYCAHGSCPYVHLAQNLLLRRDKNDQLERRELKGKLLINIELVKTSPVHDLAMLRVTIKNNTQTWPDPVRISESCEVIKTEPVFNLGFFDTSLRKSHPENKAIYDQNSIFKRWSEGIALGYTEDKGKMWLDTTADNIKGGSGGPVLNVQGEVVGVIASSGAVLENGYRYVGSQESGQLKWHTNAVPCFQLKMFIDGP